MKRLLFSIVLLLLLLDGCGSQPSPNQEQTNAKPIWITNPNVSGKVGAIGVAGRTYDQRESTKRKLAISRALDELTLQQGVKVQLNMSKRDVVTNDRATTKMDTKSHYKATSKVTAHIEDTWKDPLSGELFIWMVLD